MQPTQDFIHNRKTFKASLNKVNIIKKTLSLSKKKIKKNSEPSFSCCDPLTLNKTSILLKLYKKSCYKKYLRGSKHKKRIKINNLPHSCFLSAK